MNPKKVYTGRFVVRIPGALHGKLRREAARRGRSLNALCVELFEAGLRDAGEAGGGRFDLWVAKAQSLHREGLVGLALFGSVARGEAREGSDVDLLVVLGAEVPIARALYTGWDTTQPVDDTVNPHFVHLPRPGVPLGSLWREVALDGLILHDPSSTFARSLSSIRRDLAAGRARSGVAHGQRYWIDGLPEDLDA